MILVCPWKDWPASKDLSEGSRANELGLGRCSVQFYVLSPSTLELAYSELDENISTRAIRAASIQKHHSLSPALGTSR
jgi:hypothetical protein